MKFLRVLFDLYKLYKGVNPTSAPTTVVIEAGTQKAATAIADKIAKGNPEVNVAVTAVTHAGVSALESLIEKKVLKK